MDFKPIVAPSAKELFINEIERKIISKELNVNEKLPTERELERSMKVSRTIINSGFNELARRGFVKIAPRQGVFVADYIRNGNLDTLNSIIRFNGGKLDRKSFDSLIDFRTSMEAQCARLAAINRSEEDMLLLREIHEKVKITTDIMEMAELKIEFSRALYCATGNSIYPLLLNSLQSIAYIFNEITYRHFGCKVANEYMEEFIKAIEDKDADLAEKLSSKLIKKRINELEQWYFLD